MNLEIEEERPPIILQPGQSEVYRSIFMDMAHRYVSVNCSRGFGKSYLGAALGTTAALELVDLAINVPNKNVHIIAPTFDQVADIYYPLIAYDYGFDDLAIKHSKDTGRFKLPNNVELRLLSYESIERMRGKGSYFVVWDEVSSCKKGMSAAKAWESIIQPCITTRWSPLIARKFKARSPGRAAFLSTPDGYNDFYDFCMNAKDDPQWGYAHYDYTASPNLDPEEIERLRAKLDPIRFASEYKASFAESGNRVFYMFERPIHGTHVLPELVPDEEVHVAIDFNVGRMHTSCAAIRGSQIHVLHELEGAPNTEKLAITLKQMFPDRPVICYPDPTGRARKSSAPVGETDFTILQNAGFAIRARSSSPPLIDSANAVNARLMNANSDVNFFVHPRCKGVSTSLERTVWTDKNLDSATIDKSMNVEHYSDGIRYMTEYLFPIRAPRGVKQGHNF